MHFSRKEGGVDMCVYVRVCVRVESQDCPLGFLNSRTQQLLQEAFCQPWWSVFGGGGLNRVETGELMGLFD